MKIDKLILDEADKLSVIQEIPIKSEILVDTTKPFRGHTLFEIDCSTGDILPAEIEQINATLNGGVRKKVIIKPNCLYISCLNKKSAQKKYLKWFIEQTIKNKPK